MSEELPAPLAFLKWAIGTSLAAALVYFAYKQIVEPAKCTPGDPRDCRLAGGKLGQKFCAPDGRSFRECEPIPDCESGNTRQCKGSSALQSCSNGKWSDCPVPECKPGENRSCPGSTKQQACLSTGKWGPCLFASIHGGAPTKPAQSKAP